MLKQEEPLRLLHEVFETQADRQPNAVAVAFGRRTMTYAQIERRANRMARLLRSRGVRRGSRVALLLPRKADAYAAMLGILKAGAAYVPIDPEYPKDRAAFILKDCGADALATTAELAARRAAAFDGPMVRLDAAAAAIAAESPARLPRNAVGVGPRDLCYIIYTSGSTGRPKGVMIEHRNAWHLVREEGRLYGARPDDRVYQGASLAFDLSVEEIWLAFNAGARLVAATPEMARAGAELSRLLTECRVTVLSCVPTLLSILSEEIPTVRLLILGGEKCHPQLVERWWRPGLRMLNTYGPTEATVIATCAELSPGKPVTIGRAVPGYRVHVLDERLRPVPNGEAGEICIGGAGIARGYVGLPEQTAARFLPDPYAPDDDPGARMYRTGDLGRLDADGNLEFLGRADTQVKIRGFRVELAEIESALMESSQARAAACVVREDIPGVQQLVGYVAPRNGRVDEEGLRARLRERLPAYMVPALIETVADLPRLPSGKLDRAALPPPRRRAAATKISPRRPLTDTERRLAEIWERLFYPLPVSPDDDFFLDLGGHSLLAARMISELRREPRFSRASVVDVYNYPILTALAGALDLRARRAERSAGPFGAATCRLKARRASGSRLRTGSRRHPEGTTVLSDAGEKNQTRRRARHFLAGCLQFFGLYFVFGVRAFEWVTPYLVFFLLWENTGSLFQSAAWAALSAAAVFPLLLGAALAAKWIVLGRVRAGRYPLWGGYYLRWWFAQAMISALPLDYLAGTPWLPLVYRLLGASIGKDVNLATENLAAFDLISIGDGTSVDDEASLTGYTVEDGQLVIGPITVGRRCFVGTRSVLREGAVMADGARLEDLSLLSAGVRVPAGETWAGSPARRVPNPAAMSPPPPRGWLSRVSIAALYAGLVVALPILLLAAIAPGMVLLMRIDLLTHPLLYLAVAPLVGGSFVLLLCLEVVVFKRLLVGRVRAGSYPVHGSFYVRNWVVDRLLALALDVIAPIHATLYAAPWYCALGAKLGRFVELSTATSVTPDLLEIADGGTVADEVSLGAPRVEGGWLTVAATRLGRRAFVGNSGVLPAGVTLGDESLVGVLSLAPSRTEAARPRAAWLGSPPLRLPHREASAGFVESRTYCPPPKLARARAAVELFRVTLPSAGFIFVTATVLTADVKLCAVAGPGATLALLPLVYAACCAGVALGVVSVKWMVIGRYRPFVRPLWSAFVWRLEFVNALYEFLTTPLALDALQGTPFLPWYFRLLGARVGRRVYAHTTGLLEWDLTEIGDEAALNDDCVLQTHLFEDRILKGSRLRVGAGCVVGAGSVALYDSAMEDGSRLDALSLLMKGETLPANSAWAGIPASWQTAARPQSAEFENECALDQAA
ncbi:MAG: amino acid adenylation domain-containing protein [Verrucomicrobiota bacterium]|nr:amino acid adenylation domain-containing protein [Verrucomicrobiota bacterium]